MSNSFLPYDPMDPYGMQRAEEEQKEQQRQQKEIKKGNDPAVNFFKLTGKIFYFAFIFSSALVAAYYILKPLTFYRSLAAWEKVVAFIALAYLIICLVFFLKGMLMSFRFAGNKLWILFWLICFAFVCLLPAVAVYYLLLDWIGPSIPRQKEGVSHYQFWCIAGAVIAAAIIYSRYGLTTDKAMKMCRWHTGLE